MVTASQTQFESWMKTLRLYKHRGTFNQHVVIDI